MPEMNIRFDRLSTLAQHLEKPQAELARGVFWFAVIAQDLEEEPALIRGEEISCGTAGCAMGELPLLFPEIVSWSLSGAVRWADDPASDPDLSQVCGEIFGLSPVETSHLFWPNAQRPDFYGGLRLGEDASKDEVAANIRAFVSKMQAETAEKQEATQP